MTDYNNDINPINEESYSINTVVEIPLGSMDKIEWNSKTKEMELDRVEPINFPEPVNYGFIPKTLGGDGDNLDAILISDLPIDTGTIVESKIIGVLKFIDEGEIDDKIVATPIDNELSSLADIEPKILDEIADYYSHYKDYIRPGLTTVIGWDDVEQAKAVLSKAIIAWKKQV